MVRIVRPMLKKYSGNVVGGAFCVPLLIPEGWESSIPVLSLIQCLQKIGPRQTPPAVAQRIRHSLRVAVEPRFGRDDLIIACDSSWQPQLARVRAVTADRSVLSKPERSLHPSGEQMLRFRQAIDGSSRQAARALHGTVVEFVYPDPTGGARPPRVQVRLGAPVGQSGSHAAAPWWTVASPSDISMSGIRISLMDNYRTAPRGSSPAGGRLSTTVQADPQPAQTPNPAATQSVPTASSGVNRLRSQPLQLTLPRSLPTGTSPPADRAIPRIRILGVRSVRASAGDDSPLVPPPPPQVPPPPEE